MHGAGTQCEQNGSIGQRFPQRFRNEAGLRAASAQQCAPLCFRPHPGCFPLHTPPVRTLPLPQRARRATTSRRLPVAERRGKSQRPQRKAKGTAGCDAVRRGGRECDSIAVCLFLCARRAVRCSLFEATRSAAMANGPLFPPLAVGFADRRVSQTLLQPRRPGSDAFLCAIAAGCSLDNRAFVLFDTPCIQRLAVGLPSGSTRPRQRTPPTPTLPRPSVPPPR